MKLKKMAITGFKSFADKSVIDFPSGLSAIVGPNGCGKSNVVDALRWAMGEQSVKQLRGKSMEDVIFGGTNGKPPLNMAEVSLTLENDNGSAPEEYKDFSEIMMTRRLYRSGESQYLINKRPCRLKDIHNLFIGSGLGSRSYAVVQQGNIGAITEAGPEERRFFIEEAAGVTRFKNRKTEALRKVDSTKQNLYRLNDLILEVQRRMEGLKRQAKKAETYKKIRDRIRYLDVRSAIYQYDRFSREIHETDTLLKDLKHSDLEMTVRLQKLDAAVEKINLERRQKNQEISDRKSDKFEIQRDIDKTESELKHRREQIQRLGFEIEQLQKAGEELETKNKTLETDILREKDENARLKEAIEKCRMSLAEEEADSGAVKERLNVAGRKLNEAKSVHMDLINREARYKSTYQSVSENLEKLQRRLKQIDEEEALMRREVETLEDRERELKETLDALVKEGEDVDEQIAGLDENYKEASGRLGRQVKTVQTMEFERGKIRSEYKALKSMEDNFEWYRDGVRETMQTIRSGGLDHVESGDVIGLTADLIIPDLSYETAVEAALGDSLQYIVVNRKETGDRIIDYLKERNAGRCGVIPVESLENTVSQDQPANGPVPLLNHVRSKPGHESVAALLLEKTAIVGDRNEAGAVFSQNGRYDAAVTLDGDVVSRRGVVVGGSRDTLSGILSKKQQVYHLESELARLDKALETAGAEQDRLEAEVRNMELEIKQLTDEKDEIARDTLTSEKAHFKAGEDLKQGRRRLDAIRSEQDELMAEEAGIGDRMTEYKAAWDKIRTEVEEAEASAAGLASEIQAVSAEMERYNQRIMELKIELTSVSGKLDNSNQTIARLTEFRNDGIDRMARLGTDIDVKKDKQTASRQKTGEFEERLAKRYEELRELEKALSASETDYQSIEEKIKENDASMAQIRSEKEDLMKKIRIMELDQSQRKIKRDNISSRIEERYQHSLNRFRLQMDESGEGGTVGDDESEKIGEELASLKEKLSKIGDVNLGAITEYEEQKTRYEFLTTQKTDLEKALDDLHHVIRKINRITQERFVETFNLINEKLGEVFPRLFDGGTAKLILTEPEKPLETGVEFMVHPPGKKLTRLSLLSGGEKALSAIAFIFSIFLIKPASFCIMDEIDAPLDDANVFRFNELLKMIGETSQIIMITHKKRTMEFADMLFGITMEKKGVSKVVSVNLQHSEV